MAARPAREPSGGGGVTAAGEPRPRRTRPARPWSRRRLASEGGMSVAGILKFFGSVIGIIFLIGLVVVIGLLMLIF